MLARRFAMLLFLVASVAVAKDDATCKKLDDAANQAGDRIPGYQAMREVIGKGRLQFYAAPDRGCTMSGVFVVPKDKLVAYVEYRGYTAVMYTDGKNGEQPMGVGVVLAASGDGHRHLAEAVVPDYLLKPRFSFASQRVPLKKRVT